MAGDQHRVAKMHTPVMLPPGLVTFLMSPEAGRSSTTAMIGIVSVACLCSAHHSVTGCNNLELDADISAVDMPHCGKSVTKDCRNWFDVFRRARIVLNLGYGHRYQFGAIYLSGEAH